ncbi:MAG TPA: hypothetical protein VII06_42910 [Chloroflexota bacterium]
MRVLLACEPLLLQEVLAQMLSLVPNVELIDRDSPRGDLVLVSAAGGAGNWPARLPPAAATAPRVVAIDSVRNRIHIRERRGGRVVEQHLDGGTVALPDVVSRWTPDEHPSAAEIA